MRRVIYTAAIVMAASFVQIDRISYSPLAAQDRVASILSATRAAMGGEDKIAGVKTLTAEGPFRRTMGQRDMEGTVIVSLARPDKMHRVEDMAMGGMIGGPTIERTMVLAGTTSWEDVQNRGGMGGGMRIVMAGPGAPGPGGGTMTQEQIDEARTRRMRVQMHRLTAALFADAAAQWVDAGIAESPDGKADILEAKEETGRTLRLFIDQNTRLPLMVQYQDPKPRVMINNGGPGGPGRGPGGPGGPGRAPGDAAPMTPEQIKERMAELQRTPPEMGTFAMHLGDYKKVDGIMLPHKIETSLDGEPNEEWTIEKYKVNAAIKPETWQKK
ncbi:MAG TPA: hypothetical protein VFZ31_08585 [Vicinamibacterales bacterium]